MTEELYNKLVELINAIVDEKIADALGRDSLQPYVVRHDIDREIQDMFLIKGSAP